MIDDRLHIVDRPQGVGGVVDRNQLRVGCDGCIDAFRGEPVGLRVEIDPAHGQPQVPGHQEPRTHVGIVIHAGHHDLVSRPERMRQRAGQVQRDGGHVLTEDDLSGVGGTHEIGQRSVGLLDDGIGQGGGPEGAVGVRIGMDQIILHPVEGPAADLGSSRVVEIDATLSLVGHGE